MIHIKVLDLSKVAIHLSCTAQIAALQWDKALIKVLPEYSNYADIFFLIWL